MKKYKVLLIILFLLLIVFPPTDALAVSTAQTGLNQTANNAFGDGNVPYQTSLVATNFSLSFFISQIIAVVLGVVGALAFAFIVYAGFLWMTAHGNEQQVTKAKDIMKSATLGLTVIIFSYILVNFVLNQLAK